MLLVSGLYQYAILLMGVYFEVLLASHFVYHFTFLACNVGVTWEGQFSFLSAVGALKMGDLVFLMHHPQKL